MTENEVILVTGGAGFIGSNFILHQLKSRNNPNRNKLIVNLDLLTYAGNVDNLQEVWYNPDHIFVRGDIADKALVCKLLKQYHPNIVINFAAESHVDRSIADPGQFMHTNITGIYNLLEASLEYFSGLSKEQKNRFRFLHVSTDEVYGSLAPNEPAFTESSPYRPSSPYSASKAASDHLVRAWHHTYGLPVLLTNCSNNYGPYQFPEKLIPLVITNALQGKELPIYGDGGNIRDWLFVEDHCRALEIVLKKGIVGEFYNIGGNTEKTNLEVVHVICSLLDELIPCKNTGLINPQNGEPLKSYAQLIRFVEDRKGHDRRYAINSNKISQQLGWNPSESFETGIIKTVKWYVASL